MACMHRISQHTLETTKLQKKGCCLGSMEARLPTLKARRPVALLVGWGFHDGLPCDFTTACGCCKRKIECWMWDKMYYHSENAGCCCKADLNVGGVKVFLLFKLYCAVPRLKFVEFLFMPEWPSAVEKVAWQIAKKLKNVVETLIGNLDELFWDGIVRFSCNWIVL